VRALLAGLTQRASQSGGVSADGCGGLSLRERRATVWKAARGRGAASRRRGHERAGRACEASDVGVGQRGTVCKSWVRGSGGARRRGRGQGLPVVVTCRGCKAGSRTQALELRRLLVASSVGGARRTGPSAGSVSSDRRGLELRSVWPATAGCSSGAVWRERRGHERAAVRARRLDGVVEQRG